MPTALQGINSNYNLQIILEHYNLLPGAVHFRAIPIARVNQKAQERLQLLQNEPPRVFREWTLLHLSA